MANLTPSGWDTDDNITAGEGARWARDANGTLCMVDPDNEQQAAYVAQLATDAAGNAIGLSGGAPQAGVAFGPPSTIFRLRMRCSGGAANVTLIATKRSGGTDTFNFSLAAGDDVSEPMHAADYSAIVWYSAGAGLVNLEVI